MFFFFEENKLNYLLHEEFGVVKATHVWFRFAFVIVLCKLKNDLFFKYDFLAFFQVIK